MSLWIRSQDKERLGKIVYLELRNDDYGFYITGWGDKFEGTRIATYKTKERVLEVLDEIQSKIAQNEVLKTMMPMVRDVKGHEEKFGKLFKEMIYEMPLE